ncbi:hypothetical protein F383_29409 [Gossypium arboreum]|uniref:Uncharacterized protein n=1 Tax=Gossypium arboreum TaxID=29729 RepID=A0A0B0MUG6_GOSAR|nr:hypothetical protein F383_29409 [Gossypium arboreum]
MSWEAFPGCIMGSSESQFNGKLTKSHIIGKLIRAKVCPQHM